MNSLIGELVQSEIFKRSKKNFADTFSMHNNNNNNKKINPQKRKSEIKLWSDPFLQL